MPASRLINTPKALFQLGFQPLVLYALYRFGLVSGIIGRKTNGAGKRGSNGSNCAPLFHLPASEEILACITSAGKTSLLQEADEIVSGKVRFFGLQPQELKLSLPGKLEHWTAYETGRTPLPLSQFPIPDIKFVWEPARFGWAFALGRAYHLTRQEKYAEAFWRYFETFTAANPPCLGPHWMSAQEVALRLMALAWAAQVLDPASASTSERKARLAASVAEHAVRIPPTLVYARSQHNNHLLTEAAGLLTAGLALADHPVARRWRSLGWRWLNQGLQSQIDGYGEYAQHSTNYQRMMLQVVMWTNALVKNSNLRWPRQTLEPVKRSIHWLLSLMDAESGRVPNLGANDGAYIFPMTVQPFEDYRPVLHAAGRLFLNYNLPAGAWDEMGLWCGVQSGAARSITLPRYLGDQLYGRKSWAYLRTAQFTSRPSHADQLHLDLWWRGLNITQDAGTYLYNIPAPWDNSLTTTLVHNTVSVNGRDQMTPAGRFLYLDWVDAYRKDLPFDNPAMLQKVRGRYRGDGYRHTRITSVCDDDRWLVEDEILPLRMPALVLKPRLHWVRRLQTSRLHWLLPDWEWELEPDESGLKLWLTSQYGLVGLTIHLSPSGCPRKLSLCRAGVILAGSDDADPRRGWVSPSYGVKFPALSLALEAKSEDEVKFSTEFTFPK